MGNPYSRYSAEEYIKTTIDEVQFLKTNYVEFINRFCKRHCSVEFGAYVDCDLLICAFNRFCVMQQDFPKGLRGTNYRRVLIDMIFTQVALHNDSKLKPEYHHSQNIVCNLKLNSFPVQQM